MQDISVFLGFGQAKVTIFRCSYRKLFPFALPLKLGHFKAKPDVSLLELSIGF